MVWRRRSTLLHTRRLRDALEDRAWDGRPHSSGQRPYGYTPDAVTIIEDEAVIIREIFARYRDGASPGQIAQELTERGKVTVSGKPWQPVCGALGAGLAACDRYPGVPGPRGRGWRLAADHRPGTWTEIQQQRAYRSSAHTRRVAILSVAGAGGVQEMRLAYGRVHQ